METSAPFLLVGSDTLVGRALETVLREEGYTGVVGVSPRTLDYADPAAVSALFARATTPYVILCAGPAGGIGANLKHPASLMLDNLLVESHVIAAAHRHGVRKLLYLASSCCYPRDCPQPMRPEHLLTGPLEPSNEAYALAKIAGIALCQSFRREFHSPFISAIPANAYGPGDDFDPDNSHVVAALIRRVHEAKEAGLPTVTVWGSGAPLRDFLLASDVARACLLLLDAYDGEAPVNIGSGTGTSIAGLAEAVKEAVGYAGTLEFDRTAPDGMPRKILDAGPLLALGWAPRASLVDGIRQTYRWYRKIGKGAPA